VQQKLFRRVQPLAIGGCLLLAVSANPAQALNISIIPGATLTGNTPALGAFNRAANQWASKFADPITVNINANLVSLASSNTIGQTSSVIISAGYNTLVNAIKADAAGETDDGIVAALPSASEYSARLPTGFGLTGNLSATKANFKALGFSGIDTRFGASDATIEFNTNFAFDFDNRDGVGAGLVDFESVAAHEIGHALGFVSIVDPIDVLLNQGQTANISPQTLDMFRFGPGGAPSTLADFTANARNLVPGGTAFFADLPNQLALSTGVFNGDGRQASHWKDNGLSGTLLGVMDPTLASSVIVPVGPSDLRVLDLIGYDITTVPVPASIWLFGSGIVMLMRAGRRAAPTAI